MIKHQRRKMGMTLEEGSEGICSVSYLSKVENNMIEPSDKFLEGFIDRFDIQVLSTESHRKIEEIFNEVIDLMFEGKEIDVTNFNINELSYQSKLLNLLIKQEPLDFSKTKKQHDKLLSYLKNFNDQEVLLYVLITSKQYYQMNLHKDAFLLMEEVKSIHHKNTNLHYLFSYWKLKHAFKLNHHATILKDYQVLLSELIEYGQFNFSQKLKLEYLNYLASFEKEDVYEEELQKLLGACEKQKTYLLAKNLYYRKAYLKSLEYIESSNLEEGIILKLKLYDVLGKKEEMLKALERPIEVVEPKNKYILDFFKIKYQTTKQCMLNYLKQIIVINPHATDDAETNLFFLEQGTTQFKNQSFYKDGTLFMQTLTRKIKSNSKI